MARNATWSVAARNAGVNAKAALLNNGYCRLYTGAQPASPDVAVSTQTKLAELRFGATAFADAVNGVATANALTADPDAAASGSATWFRYLASDGTTGVHDGTVGTADANAIFATTSIVQHAVVSCTGLTLTDAAASSV